MDGPGRESRTAATGPASRTVEVPEVSFRSFLEAADPPRVGWATGDGLEVAAAGAAARIEPTGPNRFESLRAAAETAFDGLAHDGPGVARPRAFGGLAFFGDHRAADHWAGFPAAEFVVPAVQLVRSGDTTWLTVVAGDGAAADERLADARETLADCPAMAPVADPPGVTGTRPAVSRERWTRLVGDAVERIRDGDLRKVVLATALDVEIAGDLSAPAVLQRLRRTYPECFRFLFQPTADDAAFGAPPERLVSLSGREVRTEALAGSVDRGATPEEDAALAESLTDSEKIRHEQALVAEAIREWLAPLGEVTVGDRTVRKLTNIQHLETPIEATLAEDAHVLSVVEALHPTPAVGGLPRETALDFVRETEPFERGWYAAPVGWFDADGDGEFAVAIRSGVARGDDVRVFAGNGIVADSDPDDEWAEVQPKLRPVLDELER